MESWQTAHATWWCSSGEAGSSQVGSPPTLPSAESMSHSSGIDLNLPNSTSSSSSPSSYSDSSSCSLSPPPRSRIGSSSSLIGAGGAAASLHAGSTSSLATRANRWPSMSKSRSASSLISVGSGSDGDGLKGTTSSHSAETSFGRSFANAVLSICTQRCVARPGSVEAQAHWREEPHLEERRTFERGQQGPGEVRVGRVELVEGHEDARVEEQAGLVLPNLVKLDLVPDRASAPTQRMRHRVQTYLGLLVVDDLPPLPLLVDDVRPRAAASVEPVAHDEAAERVRAHLAHVVRLEQLVGLLLLLGNLARKLCDPAAASATAHPERGEGKGTRDAREMRDSSSA